MAICAIDNPKTMSREAWCDGELQYSVSAVLLLQRGFDGFPQFPFMLNYRSPDGPIWVAGQYYGDPDAIAENSRPQEGELGPDISRPRL